MTVFPVASKYIVVKFAISATTLESVGQDSVALSGGQVVVATLLGAISLAMVRRYRISVLGSR